MKVTLEIDETVLARAAEVAWAKMFALSDRYHQGGDGYELIVAKAREALLSAELRAEMETAVREVARLRLRAVVEDGVNQVLAAEVRAAVRRLKGGGTLFGGGEVEP